MTPSLAIYGNFTIDDLVFPDGSTRWAVPGGNAPYAALGASLWTRAVSIVAPIGADYPIESLGDSIDLSHCRRLPHTMRNWGLYEEDGTRHFVSRRASSNWKNFSPQVADVASGYQAAHIAPMPHEAAIQVIQALREAGTTLISLDLDDHDLLGDTSLDKTIELLRGIDLFMPSRQDALALFPDATPLEALRRLRLVAPEVTLIAIKCGADGAIAHLANAKNWLHIPAVPVEVFDTTGAGDAFCGGVLAGFARQDNPVEALLYGAISASFCIEGLGFSGLAAATEAAAHNLLVALRPRIDIQPI
ncbi:carbohydrate kinase family protein [Granulicella sp. WH15]|uniref:carbohydrate kinase family protein n=1 Tax=Granulicella sp. WH15 TaxID=2602070 RepID=UPI001367050D|nr:carbohydrate kinase family protein [Granulicella sp. WH15]QHN02890.1 carbohydrate kinase family protein [Granulicella sp. WH15]